MKETINKPLVKALLGIVLTPTGSLSGYFYIQNISETTPLLMVLALVLVPLGIYFIARSISPLMEYVTRINTEDKTLALEQPITDKDKLKSTLQKNNEMLDTWNRTNKTRDELKLMEVAESVKAQEKTG